MALTFNQGENANKGAAPNVAGIGATAAAPSVAGIPTVPWTFGSRRLNGVISYSLGSEMLSKLRTKIDDIFKTNNDPDIQVGTLLLDNSQVEGIYYSSVILTMQSKTKARFGVAYYILMLAGSNEPLQNKQKEWMGQKFEVIVPPSAGFDSVYMQPVMQMLVATYGEQTKYNYAGGMIVPADFNYDDAHAMRRLVFNAQAATFMKLLEQANPNGIINLANAKGDNTLQVTLSFNRGIVNDPAGLPTRSDVEITFASGSNMQQNSQASVNRTNNRTETFGKIHGYVDAVWAPVQQNQGWGAFNPQMLTAPTQKYAARFVITEMDNFMVPSLGAFLLQLCSALPLGMRNAWYQAFYGQSRFIDKKGGIDYTDIGALNLEANLPTPKNPAGNPSGIGDFIDTKAKDFTPEMFGMYMHKLFRDGLIYSMDVPVCGAQSWYLDVFACANRGDVHAIEYLVKECDTLTNGYFKKVWEAQANRQIFLERDNIVHLGYYETDEGCRDIRDVDTIAVNNAFGQTEMAHVRTYSDTYLQTNIALEKRLSDRWNIIQAITKNKAVCTGFAERVTFSEAFLTALNIAAGQAGLNARLNIPATGLSMHVERGVASFIDGAIVPANVGGNTFHQGYTGPTGAYNPGFGMPLWNSFGR